MSFDWWKVYVIELRETPDLGPRKNRAFPHVYVGRTTRSKEERLKAHIGEAVGRGNTVVTKANCVGLRDDLCRKYRATHDEHEADRREGQLMEELRAKGYTVHGSTGSPWFHIKPKA